MAFDSFAAGAEAVRALAQSGLNPANCRLLDEAEAALTHAATDGPGDARARLRVRPPAGRRAHRTRRSSWRAITAASRGERPNGERERPAPMPVGAWRHAFLAAPYLRDTLVACGVLSETFETAITWDRFEEFHATVIEAARAASPRPAAARPRARVRRR